MDLLGEYEKQNPQPVRAAPQRRPYQEYGFFIRLVMRLSGGRIQNTRQASYILLAAAGIILLTAILVFLGAFGFSSSPSPLHPPLGTGQ
ncbi:MAG: hypothetical protein HY007_00495 [Candidatus Sungbacteria bacterium]|nr:hypothetical protein [Candidatus Sungbacteria bacterium]